MDNTEAFESLINFMISEDYCKDEDGAYGIIENASDEMITHLTELAAAAAIPAIAATIGKAASAAGKVGKVASAASSVGKAGKKALSAVSPHSGGEEVATSEQLEVVCDYLLDEGFADTAVEAESIYDHMSEVWKQHVIESSCNKKKKKKY